MEGLDQVSVRAASASGLVSAAVVIDGSLRAWKIFCWDDSTSKS